MKIGSLIRGKSIREVDVEATSDSLRFAAKEVLAHTNHERWCLEHALDDAKAGLTERARAHRAVAQRAREGRFRKALQVAKLAGDLLRTALGPDHMAWDEAGMGLTDDERRRVFAVLNGVEPESGPGLDVSRLAELVEVDTPFDHEDLRDRFQG